MNIRPLSCAAVVVAVALLAASPVDTARAAAPTGSVGTVDTRLLLILHPLMANFDYSNGRFYRSENANKRFEEVLAELQGAQKKAGDALKGLDEQRRRLVAARTDILTRREEVINDLLSKAASEGYVMRGKEDRVREFETRYLGKVAELDAQIAQNAEQIRRTQEGALASLFLTTEETEKRVAQVKGEVQALIAEAARESGIAVVIDNTYAMRSQTRAGDIPQVPVIDEALDVVSASLFHSFANLTIDPALKAVLKTADGKTIPEEHLVVGRSIGMMNNLQRYLQFRNYLPEQVGHFNPGQVFLVGGVDLTPWVARKLFARYRVPEFLQNSFMVLLRNYADFERTGQEAHLKGKKQ